MEAILNLILNNYKKVFYPLIGFFIGVMFVTFGLVKTLIILIFTLLGYYASLKKSYNFRKWLLEKLLKGKE